MKHKVAIIGSGFASYGAVIALSQQPDVEVHILDIGLTSRLPGQPDKPIPNGKKYQGSYFTYGLNDPTWHVRLESERICSSHALGGHSTVYSGSILYPKDSDLTDWPESSRPRSVDYRSILETLPVLHDRDELEPIFPFVPTDQDLAAPQPEAETAVMGLSRIAVNAGETADTGGYTPFRIGNVLQTLVDQGRITYTNHCHVSRLESSDGQVTAFYDTAQGEASQTFDAVFLGAGCVNTTEIIDSSLFGEGQRDYELKSTAGVILSFVRLALRGPKVSESRRLSSLPEFFVEVNSRLTGKAWSHTQLTTINEQIIDAICSASPRICHPLVRWMRRFIYFSLSNTHSRYGRTATIRCSAALGKDGVLQRKIKVDEPPSRLGRPDLVKAVRRAVAGHWRTLRMLPFPFGEELGDFFRHNKLGGWHFGGTLPMKEQPTQPAECWASGEVHGLKGVFIADSGAFPTIPASTVALLTAANGHRVARQWLERNSELRNSHAHKSRIHPPLADGRQLSTDLIAAPP